MGNRSALGSELLTPKTATTDPPKPKQRRPPLAWLVGIGVVAVTGSGLLGYKIADSQCARMGASAHASAWHGVLGKVVRSGADTSGGLMASVSGGARSPLAQGAEIASGMTLATDGRTRARLEFDDGTWIVLDRATEVTVGDAPRTMWIKEGAVIADVAFTEAGAACILQSPNGEVQTQGGKLTLTATDDRTNVEVLRGEAEVKDLSRATAKVGAGQEAIAFKSSKLEVAPANDLGQRAAFGESFGAAHNEDADAPVSGLGELRARRPGSKEEKDHAVRLARHDVKVRVVGSIARTEIDETFANDTDQELEGVYRFPLPPGAQIERLALEVDGKLLDGSFIDKAKGAAIWRGAIQNATPQAPRPKEELIWVPGPWHDPALLEWQRGGRSELKIFPIPKRGSRRVVIAYTETVAPVAGVRRYVYPLPQATASDIHIDSASVDVQVLGADASVPLRVRGYELGEASKAPNGADRVTQTMTSFTPTGDLVVEYALAGDRTTDVTAFAFTDARPVKSDDKSFAASTDPYVSIAVRPKLPRWTDQKPRDQVIVVDAGRAMFGERFLRAKRLATQMTLEMDRRDRVTILACDVTCRTMPGGWKGPGSNAARDVDAFLSPMSPDGASDLVGAVRAASKTSEHDQSRDLRIVVLSDGVASAGYRTPSRVATEVKDALPDERALVITVPIGSDADVDTLAEIARGGGGVLVPYQPGEKLETAALDVLNASYGITLRDVELTLPDGLYEAAPSRLAPIRAGSETIITARMHGDHVKGDAVLRGKVGGEPFEARYALDVTSTTDAGNAFVPRLYAAARIADKERDGGASSKAELVALSSRYAVPSKFTSLLVLESEAMFGAFGIDRTNQATTWSGETTAHATEVATQAHDSDANKDDSLEKAKEERSAAVSTPFSFGAGATPTGGSGLAAASAPPSPSPRPMGPFASADSAAQEPRAPVDVTPTAMPTSTFAPPPPPPPASRAAPIVRNDVVTASPERWQRQRRGGQFMKRVFFRTGSIAADEKPVVAFEKVSAARAALSAAPDERRKHMDLVQLLSRSGAVAELADELTKWSARDPLDADAITARADLLARTGQRDDALRVLGGVAATRDGADPKATLDAVALANERAGHFAEACAFRVAAAEAKASDLDGVAAAVACERAAGHAASASRWLSAQSSESLRKSIEDKVLKIDPRTRAGDSIGFGDVTVDATWDAGAGVDVDLAVIDPSGNRLGWVGRSKGIRAADCTSTAHEALAISSFAHGAFSVEVVRGRGSAQPVSGKLRITSVGGQVRIIPFVLTGQRAQVARVDVRWDSQLVAATAEDIARQNR